jgi:aryl carrier-like protein
LEKLELQYGDYAVWQRERVERGELAEQMEYWRKQLGGVKGGMELGIGRRSGGGEGEGHEGGHVRFVVGKELKKKIEEMGRREGVTLYMSLLGGFQILLQRYSGGEEVVTGTAVAGRSRRELEGMMGFFVNTVVLRTKLGGEESVGEALRRVREVALGGYENQEVPFEKVVEELQPERERGRSPLFEVMFLLERGGRRGEWEWGGLKVMEEEEVDLGVEKFDLTLGLKERGEVLEGVIGYRKGVVDEESVRRMTGHYERVLEAMTKDRERKIGELELLSEEERQQVLDAPNRNREQRSTETSRSVKQKAEREYISPGTPLEELISSLWEEVLHVSKLSMNDNFFEIGGHSILAMQLVARIRELLLIVVPVRSVFEAPTIAEFSKVLTLHEPKPGHLEKITRLYLQAQTQSTH